MKQILFTFLISLGLAACHQDGKMNLKKDNHCGELSLCDSSSYIEPEWPDDWKDLQYDNNEVLPPAKLNKGVATIHAQILGYRPEMKLSLWINRYGPFRTEEDFSRSIFYFENDGTLTAEIPLLLTQEVHIFVRHLRPNEKKIVLVPGQETSILFKVDGDSAKILAYKGPFAKTNMDLAKEDIAESDFFIDYGIMDSLDNCWTPQERMNCINLLYDKRIHDIQTADYTPAAKDLLFIDAEHHYSSWTKSFGWCYSHALRERENIKWNSSLWKKIQENNWKYLPDDTPGAYKMRYLDMPTAYCSEHFWSISPEDADTSKCPFIWEMWKVNKMMDPILMNPPSYSIKDKECKAIYDRYIANKQNLAKQLKEQPGAYYHTYDNVAPKDIFSVLLGKHKGKAVFVYLWTVSFWSIDDDINSFASIQEQLKDKDVQFITVTKPYSRPEKWKEVIATIPGEHYYLTDVQFNFLLKRYETDGVPTYVLYDKEGDRAYQGVGPIDMTHFNQALEDVLK